METRLARKKQQDLPTIFRIITMPKFASCLRKCRFSTLTNKALMHWRAGKKLKIISLISLGFYSTFHGNSNYVILLHNNNYENYAILLHYTNYEHNATLIHFTNYTIIQSCSLTMIITFMVPCHISLLMTIMQSFFITLVTTLYIPTTLH